MRQRRSRIVILGGGFGGLSAALRLSSRRHRVILVDQRPCFEFLPNIHELLSGVKTPDLLRLPLGPSLRAAGHRFVRDTVTAIDPSARSVSLRGRRSDLRYDALIVALGGVDATRGVTGVVENAYAFKSVDQCARIGRRLEELARADAPARVVVVGGGLEGIEALGEILRRYRSVGALHVTLVEARDRLLPEAPRALEGMLRRLCAPYPVRFEMRAPVERVEASQVVLADGRRLPSELTIWTGGPAPPELLAASGLAPRRAWAPVRASLQSDAHPEVFVAGDAAALPVPLPKQGYHAIDMGVCAARNAERWLAGQSLERYRPSGKPTLISFGDLSCFLVAGERVVAGAALGAGKEAVFELVMAQLDPQPLCRRLNGVLRRGVFAASELGWPTLSSPDALARQLRVSAA